MYEMEGPRPGHAAQRADCSTAGHPAAVRCRPPTST